MLRRAVAGVARNLDDRNASCRRKMHGAAVNTHKETAVLQKSCRLPKRRLTNGVY